jgi:diguanylate cyclase (GGDEF)-like protein/PAS domain S-box-containing protein
MPRSPFSFGPIARLSLGLAALSLSLLMIGDFLFGLGANDTLIVQQLRKRLTETVATQSIVLIERDDDTALGKTLGRVLAANPDMRSLAVRRADGSLLIERGDHNAHWQLGDGARSSLEQVSVPIYANQAQWGQLEIRFAATAKPGLLNLIQQPMTMMIMLMSIGGFALYYAYLRRAMHYLDPSAAVPERVHKAFDTLTDALLVLDTDGRILLANTAFQRMNGDAQKISVGMLIADIPWLKNAALALGPIGAPWERTLRDQEPVTDVHMRTTSDTGSPIDLSVSCSLVRDDNGAVRGCLVSLNDQSQLERTNEQLRTAIAEIGQSRARIKAQNEKLQHLASRDPLTGCLNRRAFFERVAPKFSAALRNNGALCCIMTDIDHFKNFNDLYGHAIGDQVIRAVAANIERQLRQEDLLCRYGGEEFCIVLFDISPEAAFAIAERIRYSLESHGNSAIRGAEVKQITSSFGIASITEGATTIEHLIDQADTALYASKANGRNRSTIWVPGLDNAGGNSAATESPATPTA